ncbi:MAG: hypothetical protein JRJ68_04270 [Deltaproteobacteria bacterium]|nr:hypothetical protein [Deltaproteobacteria bacterium]
MEKYFDIAWEYIYALIHKGMAVLDYLLSYLHFLGPLPVIFLLACITVAVTTVLKKYIKTKRVTALEKDFQYWLGIREEAMQCDDREKGKTLAKNIDQAKLNKAYYDYFLEGLLLGFITFYLPVISMAAYINEAYRSERLFDLFGRDYVLKFGSSEPLLFGALFCYILSILSIIIGRFIIKMFLKKHRNRQYAINTLSTGEKGLGISSY